MSLNSLQFVFVENVARLLIHIYACGYTCSFGEAWRPEWVAERYAIQGKGIKKSMHTLRLAVDLNLFKDRKYLSTTKAHKPFGDYWEKLHPNNRWGGRYKDGNHYEMLRRKRK